MPRQATRLVLGRSAEARLASRLRPFSTGHRLHANDDGNRNKPQPTRRERGSAAASALGQISRPPKPSSPSLRSTTEFRSLNLNRPGVVQPPARLVRPPANLVSRKPIFRRLGEEKGEIPAPRSPSQPGGGRFGTRFGGPRPPSRFPGRGPSGGSGRFGGRPSAGRFQRSKQRGGQGDRENRRKKDSDDAADMTLSDAAKQYIRDTEMGVELTYNPSVTPSSLIGWGPAVATNTATGLHEIALRNIRVLAGGRPHSDGEQTFEGIDMKRWLAGGKPIYFSSFEQKEGMVKTLEGSKKGPTPLSETKIFKKIIAGLQKKHGEDYGAFVNAVEAIDPAVLRQRIEAAHQAKIQHTLTTRSRTVKEAIAKYALKGEHPPIKYSEDTYGKLAKYHALGSTYRPADGAKFDAKMKTLVAS